jgi:hypothetical protein
MNKNEIIPAHELEKIVRREDVIKYAILKLQLDKKMPLIHEADDSLYKEIEELKEMLDLIDVSVWVSEPPAGENHGKYSEITRAALQMVSSWERDDLINFCDKYCRS